jgi:hypothetical protein
LVTHFRRIFPLFAVLGTIGCTPPGCDNSRRLEVEQSDAKPASNAPDKAAHSSSYSFGQDSPGFVEWVSANGEYVVLQRFFRDTNMDGKVEARLGDHGESQGDEPSVELHNLVGGTSQEFDEVVALGPRMRSVVLRRGDEIKVFDTSRGTETNLPADPAPDERNPCLPARQAVFGPAGERIAFVSKDARPAVFDISSGDVTVFDTVEGLWRVGAPPLDGAVIVQVVREDTDNNGRVEPPVAQTTCASRWATRFATSVGQYGWQGDAFEQLLVFPEGRTVAFDGNLVPIGPDAVWGPRGGVMTLDGDQADLPDGCQLASVPLGEAVVVVRCGDKLGVWDPPSGTPRMLDEPAQPTEPVSVPVRPDSRRAWVAVVVSHPDGQKVGRLELRDVTLDVGPPAEVVGRPHPTGWLLATSRNRDTVAYDLASGTSTVVSKPDGLRDVRWTKPSGLSLREGDAFRVVDPSTGASRRIEGETGPVTGGGCVVRSAGSSPPFDRGPWHLVCP